jgi:hypothetical protein
MSDEGLRAQALASIGLLKEASVDPTSIRLNTPPTWSPRTYENQVDNSVAPVVHTVSGEMQGQPASMVYELINAHLQRRLPEPRSSWTRSATRPRELRWACPCIECGPAAPPGGRPGRATMKLEPC